MRIGIDAGPLVCRHGGIRRYVVELTRALATEYPSDEIHLLSDQRGLRLPACLAHLDNVTSAAPSPPLGTTRWWSIGLPWELKRRGIDLFHGTDFSIPYLPVTPSILTIHDLSPWKQGAARAISANRIRERTRYLLGLATRVVTPSEVIRREVSDYFSIPLSCVVATPLAAGDAFRPMAEEAVDRCLAERNVERPYLLFVGNRMKRKNLSGLVNAWRAIQETCPALSLVLVGGAGDDPTGWRDVTLLKQLEEVKDEDLALLLSGAEAFIYPTVYEGFGLPVLEAMRAGAPVITSRDPAIMEVAGGAAVCVDVTDDGKLAAAIVEVLTNSRLRTHLTKKGFRRASQFSWRSTAVKTRAVYEQALLRF